MKIFKQLNKKGYKHYYEGTVEELDSMDKDNQHLHSEIMQVIMWLYENHQIWIGVLCDAGMDMLFTFKIYSTKMGEEKCIVNGNMYELPTEAYEAAIEYTLKNLI